MIWALPWNVDDAFGFAGGNGDGGRSDDGEFTCEYGAVVGNARLWMTVAAVAGGIAAGVALRREVSATSPPAAPIVARFTIAAPEKATTIGDRSFPPMVAIWFSLRSRKAGASLWLRPLDSLTAQPLPGTEDILGLPFWSPDSRSLGFAAGGELRKLDLAGGTPQTLCKLPGDIDGIGGTWNRDGVILFSTVAGIYRVPATGGEPTLALRSDQDGFTAGLSFCPTVVISSFAGRPHRGRRKFISPRSTARKPRACWRRIHRLATPTVICCLRAPEPCSPPPSMLAA